MTWKKVYGRQDDIWMVNDGRQIITVPNEACADLIVAALNGGWTCNGYRAKHIPDDVLKRLDVDWADMVSHMIGAGRQFVMTDMHIGHVDVETDAREAECRVACRRSFRLIEQTGTISFSVILKPVPTG